MSTATTPTSIQNRSRSTSRTRLPSRPTTPLRPSSRNSLRTSQQAIQSAPAETHALALLEPQFAELSDGMADLEANLLHMQLMHESLARFSESFAAFLYGMNMNAFCVDFPEAPVQESFKREARLEQNFSGLNLGGGGGGGDVDNTFLYVLLE
jgi:DASH complex subunit DAM1